MSSRQREAGGWRRGATVGASLLVVSALVLPVTAADAHAGLVSSTPANGSAVQDPTEVALDFDAALLQGAQVRVVDAKGHDLGVGRASVAGSHVTQPVRGLTGGSYRIDYRAVSRDGHVTTGELPLTLTPGTPAGVRDGEGVPPPRRSPPLTSAAPGGRDLSRGAWVLGVGLVLVGSAVAGVRRAGSAR